MFVPFEVGKTYNRLRDIHEQFGGSKQSGISPSKQAPFIFIFTGTMGSEYGYDDEWDGDLFLYVGEGQVGDMDFVRGNKAIRDHLNDGRQLLLFEGDGKGSAKYLGEFVCVGTRFQTGKDRTGKSRRLIVFELMRQSEAESHTSEPLPPQVEEEVKDLSFEALRERVLAIPATGAHPDTKTAIGTYRYRSALAARYVRLRANGFCEGCGQAAPFKTKTGEPYLEAHHIHRKADGGPDHPRSMVAICPTCHRRVHHGSDGEEFNKELLAIAVGKESIEAN